MPANPRSISAKTIRELRAEIGALEAKVQAAEDSTIQWVNHYAAAAAVVVEVSRILPTVLVTGDRSPSEGVVAIDVVLAGNREKIRDSLTSIRLSVIDQLAHRCRFSQTLPRDARPIVESWLISQKEAS